VAVFLSGALCGLRGKKYTFARAVVRAGAEIGRKNKIFFIFFLLFFLPSLASLGLCASVVKNYTFARANVVIAGRVEGNYSARREMRQVKDR